MTSAFLMAAGTAHAQTRLVPTLPDLTGIVSTTTTEGKTGQQWAIVLGKALFWDQQAGSDGVACASCHFNAGADIRLANQLSPGAHDVTVGPSGDTQFGSTRSDNGSVARGAMPSGAVAGANYTLQEADFPLYKLVDETNRNSSIITTTNDIVSSQGVFDSTFVAVDPVTGAEICGTPNGDVFHAGGLPARQVALRNSSPTINAIFNERTLWDGSANHTFNGVGKFGMRDINGDPNKRLIVLNASNQAELGFVQLPKSSLASQAVGPILNSIEMSCKGRTFADVGRKLLAPGIRPLMNQRIDPTDSVLAGLIDGSGNGLSAANNYAALVKKAFNSKFWNSNLRFTIQNGTLATVVAPAGYTQMESNWSLFWGLSIMLYESTLLSNTSEFDGLVANGSLAIRDIRTGAPFQCIANASVDPLLARGCDIFFRRRDPNTTPPGGGCNACHGGKDLFNNASHQGSQRHAPLLQLASVLDTSRTPISFSDLGFQNTAVRPVFTDEKLGGVDDYGNPLSYSRQYMNMLKGRASGQTLTEALDAHIKDPELRTAIETNTQFIVINGSVTTGSKMNIQGATKVPHLRNIALNPPYTSSGMFSNLRQVLKFYNRDTNRRTITGAGDADAMGTLCNAGDNSGNGADGNKTYDQLKQTAQTCHSNVQVGVGLLRLIDCDITGDCDPETDDLAALIRFMKSLTDPRVQCDKAPFDHPALTLTVGHQTTDANGDGKADDILVELPAVGSAGYDPASGLCIPNSGNLFAPGMQGRVGGTRVPLP